MMDDNNHLSEPQTAPSVKECAEALSRGEKPDLNRFSAYELQQIIFALQGMQRRESPPLSENAISGRNGEKRLKVLIENIDDLVSLHDVDGYFLYHNQPPFTDEIAEDFKTKTIYDILDKENARYLRELADEVKLLATSRQVELEIEVSGKPAWFNVHIHPVIDNDKVSGFACVTSNITARKQIEREIIENQARYHSIFENSAIAILEEDFSHVRIDLEKLRDRGTGDFFDYFDNHPEELMNYMRQVRITNANHAALRLYRAANKQELLTNIKASLSNMAHHKIRDRLVALSHGETSFEETTILQNMEGNIIHAVLRLNIPPEYKNTWERIYTSIIDITELVRTNEALAQSQARYHSIFEDSPIAITEEDFSELRLYLKKLKNQGIKDFTAYFDDNPGEVSHCYRLVKITACNRETYRLFNKEPYINRRVSLHSTFSGTILERLKKELVALANGETAFEGTAYHLNARGEAIHTVMRLNIPADYTHNWKRVFISHIDISPRIQIEEQLKASLSEKEYLLREVHHRVKNNLQVISSLLNLQANEVDDPQILHMLRVSQDRVRSMALIHEKLYRSPNLSQIDFEDYLHSLTSELLRIFGASSSVHLTIDAAGIFLPIDSAIPCGLIINELVTNALKYAFPERTPGKLHISLSTESPADKNHNYILTVSDNGIGFPDQSNVREPDTLGLQLVNILTQQLNGTIEITGSPGVTIKITFQA